MTKVSMSQEEIEGLREALALLLQALDGAPLEWERVVKAVGVLSSILCGIRRTDMGE